MRFPLPLLALLLLAPAVGADDRKDVLVADFEGETYGEGWKTTGTAFGKGPAKGTLKGQMPVSGFLGKGLVNSFLGGDDSTGTLTSPEITIDRKYLNFLIGGGKHPGKACINLLVGGKVVRTATGPNGAPGGTEALDWHSWDVAEFEGKKAVIEIVDEQKGGWGHINVDHIVQSDTKKQAELMRLTFDSGEKYLHLAVRNGAPQRRVKIVAGGEVVREFDIELAATDRPHFWATTDVSAFKKYTVEVALPAGTKLEDLLTPSNKWAAEDKLYTEEHRPLFHFTSRTGWLNDPNGLVYADGEWHLYYQHNPFGREWGNMHWGHAVSKDLFRWKEQPIALYPKKYGDFAFSGSAVSDKDNTSGWGTKEKPPLVLAYTSTGRGECIAFSTDKGRTWTEYDKNPVVKHSGRDPKLIWHEPTKKWVMAVYDEFQGKQWIAFHTSPNLKDWTFASRIEGFYECPDLFELTVGGKGDDPPARTTRWVLYGADGKYLLGDFDGKEFKPDFKDKKQLWHGRFYAAQSFDNAPAGKGNLTRRVQIGWAQGVTFPGASFNQQMTVPVELRLLRSAGGPQLTAVPVDELRSLRETAEPFAQFKETESKEPTVLAENLDAFELIFRAGAGRAFALDLRGTKLVYDPDKKTLTCNGVAAPVDAPAGNFLAHVLVDRGSVEVFVNGGRVALSVGAIPAAKNDQLRLVGQLESGSVWRLKSAWEK